MPGQGWIECANGAECRTKLQGMLADTPQRTALLRQIPARDRAFIDELDNQIDNVHQSLWLGTRPIEQPVFANRLDAMLNQQKLDIAFASEGKDVHAAAYGKALEQLGDLRNLFQLTGLFNNQQSPDAQAFTALREKLADEIPDLRVEARRYMREQVKKLTGKNINPDKIWFHTFTSEVGSRTAFSGWEHRQKPARSQTLTDLAISNFSVEDKQAGPGGLDQRSGFYSVGPQYEGIFGSSNELPLLPSKLMSLNWGKDFYSSFKARADKFWASRQTDYRTLLKGQFIADSRAQLTAGSESWTADDHNLVTRLAAPSLASKLAWHPGYNSPKPTTPLTLSELQAETPSQRGVHRFDIYGYPSDILHFHDPAISNGNTRQLLYIPGAKPAFIGFQHVDALRAWIVEQAQDPKKRKALAGHFTLHDRQDGATLFGTSGVDSALKGLAENPRSWSRDTYINMKDSAISGDVFTSMVKQLKERRDQDANTLIKSNGELNKDLWISDLEADEQILLPLAPLGAPLGIASAAAGATLVGLGTDKVVNGDTTADRKAGAWTAFAGTLDILFSAGTASELNPERDPFAWAENETATPGIPAKKHPGDLPATIPAARTPPVAAPLGMQQISLDGEQFWVNKQPNALGHFELYRQGADGTLTSAAKYASRNAEGVWKRLGLAGGNDLKKLTINDGPTAAVEEELLVNTHQTILQALQLRDTEAFWKVITLDALSAKKQLNVDLKWIMKGHFMMMQAEGKEAANYAGLRKFIVGYEQIANAYGDLAEQLRAINELDEDTVDAMTLNDPQSPYGPGGKHFELWQQVKDANNTMIGYLEALKAFTEAKTENLLKTTDVLMAHLRELQAAKPPRPENPSPQAAGSSSTAMPKGSEPTAAPVQKLPDAPKKIVKPSKNNAAKTGKGKKPPASSPANRVEITLADRTKIKGKPRAENDHIMDVLNSRGQRTATYIKSPIGDVWEPYQSLEPRSAPTANAANNRLSWKNLKAKVDTVIASEEAKEDLADFVIHKGTSSPLNTQESLVQSAERLEETANELSTLRGRLRKPEDQRSCDQQIALLRERAQALRHKGAEARVSMILKQSPTGQGLEYLANSGLTDIKLRQPARQAVTNAGTKATDFIDTYDVKVNGQPWVVAHFHYANADSASADFTVGHLKKPGEQYAGALAEKNAALRGERLKVYRAEIQPNLAKSLFFR